jgi:hypothetical protein
MGIQIDSGSVIKNGIGSLNIEIFTSETRNMVIKTDVKIKASVGPLGYWASSAASWAAEPLSAVFSSSAREEFSVSLDADVDSGTFDVVAMAEYSQEKTSYIGGIIRLQRLQKSYSKEFIESHNGEFKFLISFLEAGKAGMAFILSAVFDCPAGPREVSGGNTSRDMGGTHDSRRKLFPKARDRTVKTPWSRDRLWHPPLKNQVNECTIWNRLSVWNQPFMWFPFNSERENTFSSFQMSTNEEPKSALPAGRSASTNPAAHSPNSRPLACLRCQQRKVKCDREQPCSSCVKARVECKSVALLQPRRRKKRFPEAELLARLRRYEELLKSYGADIDAINSGDKGITSDAGRGWLLSSRTFRKLTHLQRVMQA